ncbi:RIP metalloprotease RseP [bacterium]|nr:RIP metalloprotease RseP [bacterium]
MNALIMAGQLLLGLSLLIFIHELGHFVAARMFGIRVDKFYLFFDAYDRRLCRFKIGDTEYGIGWLPFGGYCKIAGMVDESMDTESLKKEPQPYEYRSKPAWQRFIVIVAGVFMNLVVGVFIFAMLLFTRERQYLSVEEVNRDGVQVSALAQDLGFETGDRILAVNGRRVHRFDDVQNLRLLFGGEVTVKRDSATLTVKIPSDTYKRLASAGAEGYLFAPTAYALEIDTVLDNLPAAAAGLRAGDRVWRMDSLYGLTFGDFRRYVREHPMQTVSVGFIRQGDSLTARVVLDSSGYVGVLSRAPYVYTPYSFAASFRYGAKDAFNLIAANAKGLGKVVTGKEKASESIQGPIGIATIYGAQWIWPRFWYITGMISLVLAFMNLLPIPGLDGGHLLFTVYEMITRRKPSDAFLERAQQVGMLLLMALMIFAFGNDLMRLFR